MDIYLIHHHGLGLFYLFQLHFVTFDQTLTAADLRDTEVSALVAAKLREFHDMNVPGDI